MSKRTANNLFIHSSLPRLYQQLLSGVVSYEALGNRIINWIETACAFRLVERVRELSTLLTNIPIKEYQLIGQYYCVWCDGRESKYNTKALMSILDRTVTYKTKAMLSLGAFEIYQGKIESSLYYYTEASKTSPSISDYIVLSRSVAALKSDEGFHRLALRDLENLLPIIRYAQPQVYYDYLNSYAVELIEAGRIQEASNISKIVLASPFAFAYPEWRETEQDLALRGYKSRSSVPIIKRIPENVLFMSEHEASEGSRRSPFDYPRGVTKMADWKKKMGKEPNGENTKGNEDLNKMSEKELLLEIIQLASQNGVGEHELRDILDHARKVIYGPKKN